MTVPIPKPAADVYPSERVSRLRERIIHAPREACVERARYLTRSMSAGWNEHPLTRMSQAFAEILDNISVIIREDELVVGCRTSRLKGAPFFPENKSRWIEGDVDRFEERVIQKLRIGDAEARELKEEILPFWRGRTAEERFEELLPADVAEAMDKFVFTMMLEITYGIGHFTMNHRRILERGLCRDHRGGAWEARGDGRNDERAGDRGLFYEAMIRSLSAAIRFAQRYAAEAERMAASESDPRRAAELEEIARVCRRVPEHPAQSFREAVQCVYFIHLIAQIESGGNSISLGRIDQILSPYYEADLQAGGITPEPGPRASLPAVSQDERDLEHPRGDLHPGRRGHRGQDHPERHGWRTGNGWSGRHLRAQLHRNGRLRRRPHRSAQLRSPARPGRSRGVSSSGRSATPGTASRCICSTTR